MSRFSWLPGHNVLHDNAVEAPLAAGQSTVPISRGQFVAIEAVLHSLHHGALDKRIAIEAILRDVTSKKS